MPYRYDNKYSGLFNPLSPCYNYHFAILFFIIITFAALGYLAKELHIYEKLGIIMKKKKSQNQCSELNHAKCTEDHSDRCCYSYWNHKCKERDGTTGCEIEDPSTVA